MDPIKSFVFGLILMPALMYSQNLVPNPGFEEFRCSGWYISSLESVKDWKNPTMASPDYFNNACADKKIESIPSKYYGGQHCYNGSAYVGIIACFDHKRLKQEDPGAEYIQVKLLEPLQRGEKYLVKADFSLAECSKAAVSEIGFLFTPGEIKNRTTGLLKYKPQVVSNANLTDTMRWVTSEREYIAEGGELYLTIGCFNTGSLPKMASVKPSPAILDARDYAYYFIDNVEVIRQKEPEGTLEVR